MTFLSPSFIFLFLPVALAIYAMAPKNRRVDLLPMISSVFFVCVNIHDLLSIVYYFAIAITSALAMQLYKKTKKRACLIVLQILAIISILFALIYRFVSGESAVYHAGLLICLAAVISMCADIFANQGRTPDTPWEALVYITFFPVMPAGPFVRYADLIEKLDKISFSTGNFIKGMLRFVVGFIKCVAISGVLGRLYDESIALEGSFGLLVYLVLAAVCGIRIYTFFSGYSDMARGVALMLGIDIKKDFGDPFVNSTPTNYVRRFFRSLSEFCKLYIVLPTDKLFGKKKVGRFVASVLAASFYVLFVCKSPELAILLFLPFFVLSYFLMFRSRTTDKKKNLFLRLVGGGATFWLMSAAWLVISLGTFAEVAEAISNIFSLPVFYATYEVKAVIFNVENAVIPAFFGISLFVLSRVLRLNSDDATDEISIRALIVRAVAMTAVAILFVISVVALLPQFFEIVSYANVFHIV